MRKITKLVLAFSVLALCSAGKKPVADVIHFSDWKFKTGDNMNWAKPDFDDSKWEKQLSGIHWESQGHAGYDGYAWYRKTFVLAQQMLTQAFIKDSLKINLGKIDDCDETYLNGYLIGKNGKIVSSDNTTPFDVDVFPYNEKRIYILAANDKRIFWDKNNTISIRVRDFSGAGGMFVDNMYVSMIQLSDCININDVKSPLQTSGNYYSKKIIVENKSLTTSYSGKLSVNVRDVATGKNYFSKSWDLKIGKKATEAIEFKFEKSNDLQLVANYNFIESTSKKEVTQSQDFPYILTPTSSDSPKINGAKVIGVRLGSPFLFRIPATGLRPMTFAAENLPEGLQIDASTGIITGKVSQAGEYKVTLVAKNELNTAKRELRIEVGNKLSLTPPMGWNSWNVWGLAVDNDKVKAAADAFISSGLADHGYTYVNIDDGWEAPTRAANGEIATNDKFPDMKATSDYVHSKGLRFGIYSSPGPLTCGGYLGSYQHELQDAQTYAKWGIDYLKYDWCSYGEICPNSNDLNEQKKPYILMSQCLQQQPRDIVHSMCQYGMADVWKWGGSIGGHLWRTTGDITDTWESLKSIGFQQSVPAPYAKVGNWNDPDMLIVGWVGWGPRLHPTRLSASEQYTHISLWALLSAPLLIGCDLTRLDEFTLNLLTNDEVIDIDQDPLGKSALPVDKTPLYQVWVKELEDGNKAIGIFNLDKNAQQITVDLEKVGLSGKQTVRDVWRQKNIGKFDKTFTTNVQSHGVTLIKVSAAK